MDQVKIGRFIAAARKERNLTQRQLADLLSISDKTISKWECGKGLPEVSLMLPLCEALEISVNELLTCERIPEAEYPQRAEDNMIDLLNENRRIAKEIYLRGWLTVALGVLIMASEICVSKILSDYGLDGTVHVLTVGMCGFIGILISNGLVSIFKGKKLMK